VAVLTILFRGTLKPQNGGEREGGREKFEMKERLGGYREESRMATSIKRILIERTNMQ